MIDKGATILLYGGSRCFRRGFFLFIRETILAVFVDTKPRKTDKVGCCFFLLFFVWFDALRPGKQLFSYVGTEPPLPGYYQYFGGGGEICLAQGHNTATRKGLEPPTRYGVYLMTFDDNQGTILPTYSYELMSCV